MQTVKDTLEKAESEARLVFMLLENATATTKSSEHEHRGNTKHATLVKLQQKPYKHGATVP